MRKVLFVIFSIMIILLFTACNAADNEETSEAESSVTPVEVAKLKTGDLTVERTTFGHVIPEKQTPVIIQQPGEITDIRVKTGDQVSKNTRLATIKTEMGSNAINAPIAGTVGQLTLNNNDFHTGEEPFAIIFNDDIVTVQLVVTPELKRKFKVDQTYKATIDHKEYDAEVKRIERLPNEAGQYDIMVQIDNEDEDIALGSVAEVAVKDVLKKDTQIVPTEAIITESDETYIFIVEDGAAKKVTVDVLETQSTESAIEADVKDKAEVIVTGQFLLSDGSKVDVVKDGK